MAIRVMKKFLSKYLGIKGEKPITGVINKNRFNHRTSKFYTYGLFGVSGEKVDTRNWDWYNDFYCSL